MNEAFVKRLSKEEIFTLWKAEYKCRKSYEEIIRDHERLLDKTIAIARGYNL